MAYFDPFDGFNLKGKKKARRSHRSTILHCTVNAYNIKCFFVNSSYLGNVCKIIFQTFSF